MKIIKIKNIFIVVAIILTCSFNVMPALAEGGETTLNVSPMTQKMILIPGEIAESSVKVSNPYGAESDIRYTVSIGSFSQSEGNGSADDYGVADTESVTTYNQIMDWITLNKKEGVVAPNSSDIITFTINVPLDAPAGGQYATILIRNDTNDENSNGGNIAIQSKVQIASIIYAEVAGETIENGQILNNTIPSFSFSNELEAISMVKNDGNIHADAEYILQVWPISSDEEICTNEEEASTSLVMPGTRRFHSEKCTLPPIGIFKVKQIVKIFGETSTAEKMVIICPLWLLFIILFAIIALIIWIFLKVNKRRGAKRER